VWLATFFLWGCKQERNLNISGQLDYVGSAKIYISKQPLHYKYSDKITFPVLPDQEGKFSQVIPLDSAQLLKFHINDQSYPVVAEPGKSLNLTIHRTSFPDSVQVTGYSSPWDSLYDDYYNREQSLLQKAESQLPSFRAGDPTDVIARYRDRYKLAQRYFQDTPLSPLYHKAMGEYLVKRLEELKYQRQKADINPEKVRQEILSEAKDLNFFSFESLYAQRAGIRDFTNAFANTFGVTDSLEQKYGQELNPYDVKRLGYQTLDSARTSVLSYIDERKALGYAKMHLIAERIGEMPLEIAKPSYKKFLDNFSDFPEYTSFLQNFYNEIERVSPGQPAIPFAIPNQKGEIVKMEDFEGKYVLLDFWASWCIPCLDEFPHMKELYNNYSRENFEIAAISIEKDSLRWRQTINRFQNPWPQLYAGEGFQQETFQKYRGGGIPFYILVGPKGKIIRYNDIRPSFNLPAVLDSLITNS
jgi:thiol-disulfide isomerase/thioredoxin